MKLKNLFLLKPKGENHIRLIRRGALLAVSFGAAMWGMIPSILPAQEARLQIQVDKASGHLSRYLTGVCIEDANHEVYGGLYSQMIYGESFQEPEIKIKGVSKLWAVVGRGSAEGSCALETNQTFVGKQSQRLIFERGTGEYGLENQGLGRVGMCFRAGKPYEGLLWVRTEKPAALRIALESADGASIHAEQTLTVKEGDWQRLEFKLTPKADEKKGRFVVSLRQPGAITLGYVFLQPGEWGRFKGLPIRRDVAQAMVDQGITVLRYGGSMINSKEYRWKKMIGPRDRRQPYACQWYPFCTNGWGIFDFLNFCEAAGFLAIPDLNSDETPQDIGDFIEYVNGPAASPWGARRASDGHPEPYRLKHIQLGNEEKVDPAYAAKFKTLAEVIWAKDSDIIITIGDYAYAKPITDPEKLSGAASRITNMAAHSQILELARQKNREVWFDIHLNTGSPVDSTIPTFPTYVCALEQLRPEAKARTVVYELNAQIHTMRRALANAAALVAIERDGRIPVVCSASGLQVDGQNDNGWDQGLLFMNPSSVWLQPPGYVTQMFSRNYQPAMVPTTVSGLGTINASAQRGENGRTLVVKIVNVGPDARPVWLKLDGYQPATETVQVEELAAPLDERNTAEAPLKVRPRLTKWNPLWKNGEALYAVPGNSFTILRFE